MKSVKKGGEPLSNKKIIIVTHTYVTGPADFLAEYLTAKKINMLAYIGHPFSYSKKNEGSSLTLYRNNLKVKKYTSKKIILPEVLLYIKDVLYTFYYVIRFNKKFDIWFGVNNLNAFAGILLKKLGYTDCVIFYTIDYVPIRFQNKILNTVYHFTDKLACYFSDCIWNLSPVMEIERNKRGILRHKAAPQVVVPMGNFFYKISRLNIEEIERYTIAYMGHVLRKSGIQLIFDTIPEIVLKVPKFKFVIIGDGDFVPFLQEKAKKLGISKCIEFAGLIKDHNKVENLLCKYAVGMAPYVRDENDYTQYTDPGKPKIYMACGLPVIITKITGIAYEIDENKAGFAIDYDKEQLLSSLLKLLMDDNMYKEYRQNAINLAKKYEWNNVFDKAFKETIGHLI